MNAMQMTASNVLAFVDVPSPKMSQASTLASVFQQVSSSLGISAAALTLQAQIGPGGPIVASSFFWPFIVLGLLTVCSIPDCARGANPPA